MIHKDDGGRSALNTVLENENQRPHPGVSTVDEIVEFCVSHKQYFKGRVFLEAIWEITRLRALVKECDEVLGKIGGVTYGTELCNTDAENNEILASHFFAHQKIARALREKLKAEIKDGGGA